ncbi:hypothetical protein [Kutzneria buriramensis]|uniref:DUF5709 domain-containing protein n=1 Tax=Kutzneria buriramensis TaxID=1045776 RepID=A0A3E0H752_9PSEU|nr:hypothetical protein [Kutzneria buriramensis]REH39281.1 hypothetical protein BCF44_113136 [Kutzneria buriramensis]
MSEERVGYTPENDSVEDDPAALSAAEELDEECLEVDPLEAGMDPPERWAEADKYGMTPYEEAHPKPFSERLDEEEPDVGVVPTGGDPDLDREVLNEAVRRGEGSDEAGGSVASTLRTPPSGRDD